MARPAAWSKLAPSTRARWDRRARAEGFASGRSARAWSLSSPRTKARYSRFGSRFGLSGQEVRREPELVRAFRRHPRFGDVNPDMIAHPWRYNPDELFVHRERLHRGAATRWGLLILEAQRRHLVSKWTFLTADQARPEQSPWHTVSRGFADDAAVAHWLSTAFAGIDYSDWMILVYEDDPAFPWQLYFPEESPGGGERR
ncbi:MAG TPA: hypothetical protein VN793_00560 [Acidimicrobiales bacterium]|nr:hypothetical protein [Acidimicrobiales bacterium]